MNYDYVVNPCGVIDPLAPVGVRSLVVATGWCGLELDVAMSERYVRIHHGMSTSKEDLRAGGICAVTGATAPASRMKTVNGKRVIDIAPYNPRKK